MGLPSSERLGILSSDSGPLTPVPPLLVATILVIDLGTSSFKFARFDGTGRLRGICRLAPPARHAPDGTLELTAEGFVETIAAGIGMLAEPSESSLADVKALTFATQTNSFLLLGADDRPLTPILLWPDRRAASLQNEIEGLSLMPGLRSTTGVPQLSCQFMVAKLLWLARRSPGVWRHFGKLCLISDYLTLLLTGHHVTEVGAAGLTGLLDIHRGCWWPPMLDRIEVDPSRLPTPVRAGTDLGRIAPRAAKRFGLPGQCRFLVGCLDQYAGAIGAGNVAPEAVSETTGTVLATVSCAGSTRADLPEEVFQGPAFCEGLFYRMAFGEVSANYLQWYRDQLPDRPTFDALVALAEPVEPGAEGLTLNTACPPGKLEEVVLGLGTRHTRGHVVRCILETVAWALREQVGLVAGGKSPAEVRSAGGGARSELWLQIKADVLGTTVVGTECPEPTSLGAAIVAEAATSGSRVAEVAPRWVHLRQPHHPDRYRHRRYVAMGSPGNAPRRECRD